MRALDKPKNKWGWVRLAGLAALVGAAGWTLLAAGLRSAGGVPWMAWSGYQDFSAVDGLALAVLPLLAAGIGGWLEDQDHQWETEQSRQREAEKAAAEQQKKVIKQFHESVLAVMPDATHDAAEAGERIAGLVRAALAELDGKGKGEILHFLFEKGLLSSEPPVVALAGADFGGAALHKAHLPAVGLARVDLNGAKMDGCHLVKGRFWGSNLSKAFLRHADLREAVLAGCDLRKIRLDHANLEGADLSGANLEGAFLANTNLKHCVMGRNPNGGVPANQGSGLGNLDEAVLIDTILPDGRKVTNEKGRGFLQRKEIATLIDRL